MLPPERLRSDGFDMMWNFLMMGGQKSNIPAMKEHLETLRNAMLQKTAGQRKDKPKDVDFDDVPTLSYIAAMYAGCFIISETGELRLVCFWDIPKETNYLADNSGYRYTRPDGGVTVSIVQPEGEYTPMTRLVADEGYTLTDGTTTTGCTDTATPEAWQEIPDLDGQTPEEKYEALVTALSEVYEE